MSVEHNGIFARVLAKQYEQTRNKDALGVLRELAWEKCRQIGLADRKMEAFHSIPLRQFYATATSDSVEQADLLHLDKEKISQAILPECAHSHLLFVDGVFRPDLSDLSSLPSTVVFCPLAQAMRSWGQFLQKHLLKKIEEEKDPFALINLALHPAGLFLYIPANLVLTTPIQCLYVSTGQAPRGLNLARIQLMLGANSRLEWLSTYYRGEECPAWQCSIPLLDVFVDQAAQCHLLGQIYPEPSHWCFDNLRAHLKRDAKITALNLIFGSKTTRHDAYVQCAGENSEADLKGLWMLQESLQAHVHATIDHSAPHTRSMQLFKGILFDASQSSFAGKILVKQEAQKTQAYQLNKNLLLGKAAIAQSRPHLEIHADDVKASHGATVAQPTEAELFYLKSRGITEEEAKQLLIVGFYREILDQIPYARLKRGFS